MKLSSFAARHSIAAIVCLSLASGAAASVLVVCHAAFLAPLPFPDADRTIVVFGLTQPRAIDPVVWFGQAPSLEVVATCRAGTVSVAREATTVEIRVAEVSASFFEITGAGLQSGRWLTPADETGAQRVAVVSADAFGSGTPGPALGEGLLLNGERYTIVGIASPSFTFPGNVRIWLPRADRLNSFLSSRINQTFSRRADPGAMDARVLALLRPGSRTDDAEAELLDLQKRLAPGKRVYVSVSPLRQHLLARSRDLLQLLMTAAMGLAGAGMMTFLVLNALAATRLRQRWSICLALGAAASHLRTSWWRHLGLVAVVAGALAATLTRALLPTLLAAGPTAFPTMRLADLELRAAGVAAALVLFAVGVEGVASFRRFKSLTPVLLESHTGTASPLLTRRRHWIVAVHTAAVVFLCAVSLHLFGALLSQLARPSGLETDNRVGFRVTVPASYESVRRASIWKRIVHELESWGGTRGVAITDELSFADANRGRTQFTLPDRYYDVVAEMPDGVLERVSPGFFRVMGLRVLAANDSLAAPGAVFVDERTARRFWPGESPLGRTIALPDWGQGRVAGVVANSIGAVGFVEDPPRLYVALDPAAAAPRSLRFIVWTDDPNALRGIATMVTSFDPNVAVSDGQPVAQLLARELLPYRLRADLFGVFAIMVALIGTLGVACVMFTGIHQRQREITIRQVLGATTHDIVKLMMRYIGTGSAIGLCGGVTGAVLVVRWLSSRMAAVDHLHWGIIAAAITVSVGLYCVVLLVLRHSAARLRASLLWG